MKRPRPRPETIPNERARELLAPSERDLQEQTRALLKILYAQGEVVVFFHAHDSQHSQPGYPDWTIGLKGGRVLWIELKSANGKLSPAQEKWAEFLGKGRWALCRSFEEFREELERRGVRIGPR